MVNVMINPPPSGHAMSGPASSRASASHVFGFCDIQVGVSLHSQCHRAHPQQGDLRLSSPLSGQGAGGGARTRNRRVPADL
ncbi:hypothetical protein PoB_001758900 [Plakobranchus ocellatus]|uniref:Uncharacterized protein n=1 Tax=Plakobranchus ocellatus TaxID=259542 RepID=A0AAV3Z9P1_9GAST|nr:hypothetical protein PoB_001758900 [Plakobranchus ocellatus]